MTSNLKGKQRAEEKHHKIKPFLLIKNLAYQCFPFVLLISSNFVLLYYKFFISHFNIIIILLLLTSIINNSISKLLLCLIKHE